MTKLLLVRHGDAGSTTRGRYWGHTDIPLSPNGEWQAERVAAALPSEHLAAVYSSDLRRAFDTATIIASRFALPIQTYASLREMNFGRCEGMGYAQVLDVLPTANDIWYGRDIQLRFPDGESISDLSDRIDRFLPQALGSSEEHTVLIVGHAGSLAVLLCKLIGLDLARWWHWRIDCASITTVNVYGDEGVLAGFNELCHLQG